MKASGSENEAPVPRSEKKVTETSSSKACKDSTGQHSAGNSITGLDVLAAVAINGNFYFATCNYCQNGLIFSEGKLLKIGFVSC